MSRQKDRKPCVIRFFSSLEEENRNEHHRLSAMSPQERLDEFAALQERTFGKAWTHDPMIRQIRFEKLDW